MAQVPVVVPRPAPRVFPVRARSERQELDLYSGNTPSWRERRRARRLLEARASAELGRATGVRC